MGCEAAAVQSVFYGVGCRALAASRPKQTGCCAQVAALARFGLAISFRLGAVRRACRGGR
jgi:hypothetical protein